MRIYQEGYKCTLGEILRTQEQAKLYADRGIGIKNSKHLKKLAVDINLFSDKDEYLIDGSAYKKFGEFWEALHPNNRWGGRFSDSCHFQMNED